MGTPTFYVISLSAVRNLQGIALIILNNVVEITVLRFDVFELSGEDM